MAAKRKQLTKDELQGIIRAYEGNSIGGVTGDLATEREEALKRYNGEPYGDEVEGRSSVISKDVADAIDWIMPSLMRVFLSRSDFVQFSPTRHGDEKQAELETEYVNNILMRENNGFLVLYDWFWDALLLRNGYVKYFAEETDKVEYETFKGLTEFELAQMLEAFEATGNEYEIVEQQEGMGPEGLVFDIKIKCTRKETGRFCVEPVPPEELRIDKKTRGQIQHSRFTQHCTTKTRSELREMGLSQDFVEGLPTSTNELQSTGEALQRSSTTDEQPDQTDSTTDPSMQLVDYKESVLYVDFDGDGIAELRKVTEVGDQIPDGDDWNEVLDGSCYASIVPKRIPHRHVGVSIQDTLHDLARIKTQLTRLLMDNTYLLTNLEWLVNERVNLADFMVTRPGGIKRVKDKMPVAGSAEPVKREPIIQHVLPVLDYIDSIKTDRTGIDKNMTGLDPDTLKWTTSDAARQALQQANLKIEMIARMFAETGVRDLALGLRRMAIRHRTHARPELIRGEWQDVNPSEWTNDRQVIVNVGIGTGSAEEVRSNLMLLAGVQEKAHGAGIVTAKNAYNLAERISDSLGYREKGVLFTDPESDVGKKHLADMAAAAKQNPLEDVAKVQGEYKLMFEQIKAQSAAQVQEMKNEMDAFETRLKTAVDIFKAEIEALQAGLDREDADAGEPGIGAEIG